MAVRRRPSCNYMIRVTTCMRRADPSVGTTDSLSLGRDPPPAGKESIQHLPRFESTGRSGKTSIPPLCTEVNASTSTCIVAFSEVMGQFVNSPTPQLTHGRRGIMAKHFLPERHSCFLHPYYRNVAPPSRKGRCRLRVLSRSPYLHSQSSGLLP